MKAKLLVAALLIASPTNASEPTMVDACVRAAEHYFQTDGLVPTNVQAFPDLKPPRVRAIMAGEGVPAPMSEQVALLLGGETTNDRTTETVCEFESASAPFRLSGFDCGVCLMTDNRLEEIQALMKQEGL